MTEHHRQRKFPKTLAGKESQPIYHIKLLTAAGSLSPSCGGLQVLKKNQFPRVNLYSAHLFVINLNMTGESKHVLGLGSTYSSCELFFSFPSGTGTYCTLFPTKMRKSQVWKQTPGIPHSKTEAQILTYIVHSISAKILYQDSVQKLEHRNSEET